MENDQSPVTPLESSSPSVGRGILDKLIGGNSGGAAPADSTAAPVNANASPAYTEPLLENSLVADGTCPNCAANGVSSGLDGGICPVCEYDQNKRWY